jgi:ABC-type branched-subunit amino acid transport system substrate-binding protein/DNA-binding CsgD family transcriptional regulator
MSMTEREFENYLKKVEASSKEIDVLIRFLQDQSDSEIAAGLTVELITVRTHIRNIRITFHLYHRDRDELRKLFILYKGEWVANCIRERLGYPIWENLDHIGRSRSNYYLKNIWRCRDYEPVIRSLEQAVNSDRSDPYIQIDLNNAKAHQQGQPLKIVVVVANSGNYFHEFAATQVLRGVADAQTQFNKDGGKDGRWLAIRIYNDRNQPFDAREVAIKSADDPSNVAVLGHHSSEGTEAALSIYEEASIAIISPTSTSSRLRGRTFFRAIGSTEAIASKYTQYIKEHLRLDKIAVLYCRGNEFSETLKNDFENTFKRRGGRITETLDITTYFSLDIKELIQMIREESIAALVISSIETNSVAIAIASENSTLEPQERLQLLFATSLPETPTLEKGLTAVEGAVLVSPCLAEESDYMQQARIRWGQQEINWRVATSYDATQALIEAIRLSEVPTREEILNNLEGLNLSVEQTSGFGLKWSESDYHSNAQRPYCIAQIRNRRFEEIF